MAPKRKRDDGATYSRMDVWARGVIWGMSLMGASREQICECALKKDGTQPTARAIDDVLARKKAEPEWRGEEVSVGLNRGVRKLYNALGAKYPAAPDNY